MRLPFVAEAAAEFDEAAQRYERERPGFGSLFTSAVLQVVDRAGRLPRSGARVPQTDPEREVRRFPYSVITAIVDGQPAVVAIAHGRREFGYWRGRVE